MPYKNKEIHRQKSRELYERNKESIRQYKSSNPCIDCGNYFEHFIMEFDHREGEVVRFRIGKGSLGINSPAVVSELKKCDLVCANCHKRRTHIRGQLTKRRLLGD